MTVTAEGRSKLSSDPPDLRSRTRSPLSYSPAAERGVCCEPIPVIEGGNGLVIKCAAYLTTVRGEEICTAGIDGGELIFADVEA